MNENKFKSLSIIIPNYNGEKLIPVFLPSVIKAVKSYSGETEIIIVDDCSSDNSIAIIKKFSKNIDNIKLIRSNNNKGFSKTCNLGIINAKKEILFFLNTDVALKEDFFNYFSNHFEDPDVFAVTICGFQYSTDKQIDGIKLGFWNKGNLRVTKNIFNEKIVEDHIDPPYLSFSVQGAYFFADAKKIKDLEGFDELFSPYIFEETDLAYRALKRGWKIIYEPKCIAYHKVGSSLKSVAKKFRLRQISSRNRLIFIWKNIHSKRLLLYHMIFLVFRLLALNVVEWTATIKALKLIREIKRKRKIEIQNSTVRDEDLLKFYSEYFSRF